MARVEFPLNASSSPAPDEYEPPALTVMGTVEEITQGPDPDSGDVPTGVISF